MVAKTTIEKIKLNNWSRSYNINVLSMPLALVGGLYKLHSADPHLQPICFVSIKKKRKLNGD